MKIVITQAASDRFPFQKDHALDGKLPVIAEFDSIESARVGYATLCADWIMSASDSMIKKRAKDLSEMLVPAERLAECSARVEHCGWRYRLTTGWVRDGYVSSGADPQNFVLVHLSRATTVMEDAESDYRENKGDRDRAWHRAGM